MFRGQPSNSQSSNQSTTQGTKRPRDAESNTSEGLEPPSKRSKVEINQTANKKIITLNKTKSGADDSTSSRSSSSTISSANKETKDTKADTAPQKKKLVVVKKQKADTSTQESKSSSEHSSSAYTNPQYEETLHKILQPNSPLIRQIKSIYAKGKNIQEEMNIAIENWFKVNFGAISTTPSQWFNESNEAKECGKLYAKTLNTEYLPVENKCHSLVLTKIKGETICYVAVSGRYTPAWEDAAATVDLLNSHKIGIRWSMVEERNDNQLHDHDNLIADVLTKLDLGHNNPNKVCAEKSYLAMLLKLLVKYGSDLKVLGVVNCLTLEGNKWAFIPCCSEGCTPNKPSAMILCAAAQQTGIKALEAHERTPKFTSPIFATENVYLPPKEESTLMSDSSPSSSSSSNSSRMIPILPPLPRAALS